MTKDEVLQMALEALEKSTRYFNIVRLGESRLKDTEIRGASHAAITAIKAALAQPEQSTDDPVAWMYDGGNKAKMYAEALDDSTGWTPLYTSPPKREWKGLTDEEIYYFCHLAYTGDEEFLLAVEAKLKEKNNAK